MKRRTQSAGVRTKAAGPSPRSSFCVHRSSFCASAFTMAEIMIVIVIIVLMLSMAMPVFRLMTGSRSEESASNQIAGMLGRARSEAIGLQRPVGVAFFPDSTGRYQSAVVEQKSASGLITWASANTYSKGDYVQVVRRSAPSLYYVAKQDVPSGAQISSSTYWQQCDQYVIDKTTDSDAEALPMGVAVQLINDWGLASGGSIAPKSDAYVSAGVIMFDSQGRLMSNVQISINSGGFIGSTMQMFQSTGSYNFPEWTGNAPNPIGYAFPLYPSFGLVLFDKDAFQSQGFDTIDPTYSPHSKASYTTAPNEQTEESWLDQNATPLLINRFNGTLIKGE
jgi:Tfp pilus assembly protein FimT